MVKLEIEYEDEIVETNKIEEIRIGLDKKKPTICLNMIVKNESRIIKRMFDSVIPIIDSYCICDTGSTDDTVSIITEYFKEKNIPGKIVVEPFKDFSHNRNVAITNCLGLSDYILLMDADMLLKVGPEFKKEMLSYFDSFHLLQGHEEFYYKNMRIVRNNGLYSYMGVTHEYVNTPPNQITHSLNKDTLFILDIGDGGSKGDKFDRDIKLLLRGIEENPNSDRYHFYLANSYFDSGKFEEAIETYKKRIKLGGWNQEVWYSHYRIGLAYKDLKRIEEAISWWLDAYNYLPTRIENLYEIIQHYRVVSKCRLAYQFYKIAKEVLKGLKPGEKDDFLFLKNDIYTYKLEYELSIISCYVGINNINEPVIEIFNNSNEQGLINNVLSNLKFYNNKIVTESVMDFGFSMNHLIANKYRSFNSSSTSIIKSDNGYLMNVRLVNYTIDDKGCYHNCDDHIITINKCIELSNDFKIVKETLINSSFDNRRYVGIEDIKIFNNTTIYNEIIFIGSGLHKNQKIGMCYGKYDSNSKFMESIELKASFNMNSDCEKNWVFYMDENNELKIIYKWFPLQICNTDDINSGLIHSQEEKIMPKIFKHARGSSNGYTFKDEIWFINHLVSYEEPRHYYHIISVFDKKMNLLRYTCPFKFEGICIEYCLSLIVEENRIIIPYSTWDRTTKIAIIGGHDPLTHELRSFWNC
jgi:tetratricopeptide (TPR) repeat protein